MSNPAPKTGHIGLNVSDLDRSVDFYREVFAFELFGSQDEGDRRFAFLGSDGVLQVTLWQQSDGTFPTDRPGLHHLSFEAADIAAVQRTEATLKRLGAKLFHDGVVPHGEGASSGGVFFADPDGIRLELYAPSGADTAPAPVKDAPTCGFF
ncbi:VOC family protein [Glycomyces sp. NPDC048151]|uniref:VOC family protein n=1 Tax=Glycomyces sp. NPDC048151 TaxID=3364002 RepID=UPI003722C826